VSGMTQSLLGHPPSGA